MKHGKDFWKHHKNDKDRYYTLTGCTRCARHSATRFTRKQYTHLLELQAAMTYANCVGKATEEYLEWNDHYISKNYTYCAYLRQKIEEFFERNIEKAKVSWEGFCSKMKYEYNLKKWWKK